MRDPALAQLNCEYQRLWGVEHFFGARVREAVFKGRKKRLEAEFRRVAAEHGRGPENVDARASMEPEEFYREYVAKGRPVVLRSFASHWPALSRWTLEYFRRQHGDHRLLVLDPSGAEQFVERTLAEVIDEMSKGLGTYARVSPLLHERPDLVLALRLDEVLRLLRLRSAIPHTHYHFFLGPAGAFTQLHAEPTDNLFIQVAGRKRWLIFRPEWAGLVRPRVDRAPVFFGDIEMKWGVQDPVARGIASEAILEPGDVLYNPAFHWHYVENLEDAIGVGYRWGDFGSMRRNSRFMTAMYLLAIRPPLLYSLLHSKDTTKVVSYGRKKIRGAQ